MNKQELFSWTAESLAKAEGVVLDQLIQWSIESDLDSAIQLLGLVVREKCSRHLETCHNPENCDWSPLDF